MTIYVQTLSNPGAEAGSMTGWTVRSGTGTAATGGGGLLPHTGSYLFSGGTSSSGRFDQDVAIDPSLYAAVDAGVAALKLKAYHGGFSGDTDGGRLVVDFYDAGMTLLSSYENSNSAPDSWTLETLFEDIPPSTRTLRVGVVNFRSSGTNLDSYWDDFTLEISDDMWTDYAGEIEPRTHQYGSYAVGGGLSSLGDYTTKMHQLGAYSMVSEPAEYVSATQMPIQALVASETSNGLYKLFAHQLGAYALVRPNGDRRELRAWTFKQDDHEFYGIQLGSGGGTLVWDKLTGQWCTWKSPGEVFWRVEDVVDWEGYNIACDTNTGKLWEIDPDGRLDYDTTPINSTVVGYLTHRFRNNVPCYMAELALSEGQPPTGFDDGTVGITLRTSTDDGTTFISHGEVVGEGISEDITVRWYGLGLMKSPGMIFEITDTGYARRIDGLDIETIGE